MEGKEQKKNKTVLLMSGGLDSTLIAKLFKPDVLLYCKFYHRYQENELKALIKILEVNPELRSKMRYDSAMQIGDWEREDAVIPLRNFLAASVASRYGDKIWMGFLKGELATDKSKQFLYLSMALMNECYRKSDWCEGRDITIESPVQDLTKVQLVALALKSGLRLEQWMDCISCFGESGRCGKCRACFKKDMAHELNGIELKFDTEPKLSEYAIETRHNLEEGKYTGIRELETALYLYWKSPVVMKFSSEENANQYFERREVMMKGNFTVNA